MINDRYTTENVSTEATTTSSIVEMGGIAGQNGFGGTVTACYATGTVSASASGTAYGGGIVGYNYGTISNCVALNTDISAPATTSYTGRVAGQSLIPNTLLNNYAIAISSVTPVVGTTDTVTGIDGATITITPVTQADFTTASFSFGNPANDTNPWVWDDANSKPILWWQVQP